MLVFFTFSICLGHMAAASACCDKSVVSASQEASQPPCHKTQKQSVPEQAENCAECACLHCPLVKGLVVPVPDVMRLSYKVDYFLDAPALISHLQELYSPPPRRFS